ncbi:uncharacterized protein BO66DRAFT_432558 [Aspergillus aculeatinus CBS 121060]|uniref:Uncharacterized protein n=1 Tax=Aspergillus aculeatinus CBS 121060 TaxID=1448322 RepID=A0ACD1GTD9_9EURO|nr:hypothetical protein BO66DRAFT_432558 [Aspergillus aculeatinus CBS 121060]RAH64630.1 hypothetical protein BO66DRAFT_432558 [Aspergillus aculeatinus CBS 121060]
MSSITHVLTRYATEFVSARLQSRQDTGFSQAIPPLVFLFTFLAFAFALICVDYTCNHVIVTLAAIEDADPSPSIRLESAHDDNPAIVDPFTSRVKPITSEFRSAIKHLRARGGGEGGGGLIISCLHGFRMYFPFYILDRGVGFFLNPIFYAGPARLTLASFAVEFAARMCLATVQMAWVHVIIADRSPRGARSRETRGLLGHWPRIAPAAALQNALVCVSYTMYLVAVPAGSWAFVSVAGVAQGHLALGGHLRFVVVVLIPAILSLLVTLPARVVFVRVAASMLPEEDVPFVPFDRRFDGKVRPKFGGTGERLGIKDAWTTVARPVWVRCFKITLKALVMEVAVVVAGILVIIGELFLVQLAGAGF